MYPPQAPCYWTEPAQVPGAVTNTAEAVTNSYNSPYYYFVAWKKAANNTIWYDTFDTLKP